VAAWRAGDEKETEERRINLRTCTAEIKNMVESIEIERARKKRETLNFSYKTR